MQEGTQEISDPARLTELPLISVLMITYNHADYLAEAIEGVVSQQCNFHFELIIGEDRSSDSTLEIAISYQKKHPEIIRVVHSGQNVGMNENSLRIFRRARGKYVAYCEGDDYWCTTDKLAKQVAAIEADEGIGIVHGDWVRSRLHDGTWRHDYRNSVHSRVPSRYLEGDLSRTWHFPKVLRTCTILLRRDTMAEWYASGLLKLDYKFGDAVLSAWITTRAKVAYVPAVVSVYRVSPSSALRSGTQARVAFYKSALAFDNDASEFFAATPIHQKGYRWEASAGLLLWAAKATDWPAMRMALETFFRNFSLFEFIASGAQAVIMRLPTLKRQPRELPVHDDRTDP